MHSPSLRVLALAAALSAALLSEAQAQQTPPAAPASSETRARPARTSRDVIAADEMAGATDSDAYALVSRLRSQWLRTRGVSSLRNGAVVWVHINGAPSQGVAALRQLQVADILEIRHLDAISATQRFGTDYGAGAILVQTR